MTDYIKQGLVAAAIICIMTVMAYLNFKSPIIMKTYTDGPTTESIEVQHDYKNRDMLVIGILSRPDNNCIRDAHRKTFISKAKAYKKLDVRVFFVLDEETPDLSEEQRIHQDIVFLNSTVRGYNRWFGVKLYVWLKYVMTHFPNVSMLGRMDDDAFLCTPQIFDRLYTVKHDMLYYGYPTAWSICPTQDCVDDMFLIIGNTLASRIVNRPLCTNGKVYPNCLKVSEMVNRPLEFRQWIMPYKDIKLVDERENNRMIWHWKDTSVEEIRIWRAFRTWDFCRKYLLFHKAKISDLYKMDFQNNYQLKFGFRKESAVMDIPFTANCSKSKL